MKSFLEIKKIKDLKEQGYSKTEISNTLGISLPTINKYLNLKIDEEVNKNINDFFNISSIIQPFTEKIDSYIERGITNSKKIEFLIKSEGYTGSYQTLNNYIKDKRKSIFINGSNSYIRVETQPGEQAQVDWGHFGKVIVNGNKLNLYCFVFVLSYSRALYIEFVTSQKQKVLQNCHLNAFLYLGGIPKKIRYDNMKTIVVSRDKDNKYGEINFNYEFKNFAKYYNFELEVCPPYYPQSKGKVEAKVKYVRRNFFNGEVFGKTFNSIDELNEKAKVWLNTNTNIKKHPVVKDSNIDHLWREEKLKLRDVSQIPTFFNTSSEIRTVSDISMVFYKNASYEVPKEYIQCDLEVKEITKNGSIFVEFYYQSKKITEYLLEKSAGWKLLDEKDQIKKKTGSAISRVKDNPIYSMKVETRDLNYYSNIIEKRKNG